MLRRKILLVLLLLVAPIFFNISHAYASTQDFVINNFSADYYLSKNSANTSLLAVEEVITATFPQFDQNHGILRAIPKTYQGHTVSLDVQSVTNDNGQPWHYSSSTSNDNGVLKIGDANTYVHGQQVYKIKYTLRNVINFQNTDEFYWDINGDQWQQPVEQVSARVHIPKSLVGQLTGQHVCYSGSPGDNQQNCTMSINAFKGETVISAEANSLSAGQTLTAVVGFTKGTFVLGPEIALARRNLIIGIIVLVVATSLLPIITFIILYRKWRSSGRDPKGRGVIIPEYVAPKNLNVLSSSFILNQTFEPKAASAGIIELAVQGYLRLSEIEKKKFLSKSTDYQIEVIKDPKGLPKEQQLVLDALFDGAIDVGATTNISSQKNKLYTTIQKINDHLSPTLTTLGYFQSDPQKAKKRFLTPAIILLVAGFFLFALLPLGIGLILSAVVVFIFSAIMPARTPQGVETRDYLLGLKEYIKMAEADRLNYLQSPQGVEKKRIDPNDPKQQIKLFENLLPYAMLFGLEKEWAKQFKDLYTQPPSWYSGNVNGFNAIYLANSLSSFSSANSVAFSAPSSSNSSGFGGGGFSGGGGGGGGGGGW